MGLKGKLEVEVDIKTCGDVFHELLGSNPHHVSNMTPNNIHGCDLLDGEYGKPGSIIVWEYTLDGNKEYAKELIEVIDEEKKLIRYKVVEDSDLLKVYKSMTISVEVIAKDELEGLHWVVEFEKFDVFGPYPTNLMDLLISITRDIEAHHLNES